MAEAFRPWLELCGYQATAEQILELKICDPAMGSGAFLVAVCRFLATWLVQAWERDGYPEDFRKEWDKDLYARRLIAQRCLYGVDKNPFAVNLAKLSLWLVTLSKNLPFTFVDHALKAGDSLVGHSVKEIRNATQAIQLVLRDQESRIYEQLGIDRRESFSEDTRDDATYERKRERLKQQIKESEGLRRTGDLMVAAFFDAPAPKDRYDKQQVYLAMLSDASNDSTIEKEVEVVCKRLSTGDKGIVPFHWDLEFPEVFSQDRVGFDLFVGNPPFLGGSKLMTAYGARYPEYLRHKFPESNGKGVDLCAFFFRLAALLTSRNGTFSLIATKRISQGDTGAAGLGYILNNGFIIYSAIKTKTWPGAAAVVISEIHVSANPATSSAAVILNGKRVNAINSRLRPFPEKARPHKLNENRVSCFAGCKIYGEGFIFAKDPSRVKPEYAGGPDELALLLSKNPRCAEVISEYIGGKEVSTHPQHEGFRRIINFGDLELESIQRDYPEALRIVEEKVKPVRDALAGDYKLNERRKKYWWKYVGQATNLASALSGKNFAIAMPRTTTYIAVGILDSRTTFSEKAIVFPPEHGWADFALLSSRFHEIWALEFCLSQGSGDSPVYKPEECRHTLPVPKCFSHFSRESVFQELLDNVSQIGRQYFEVRGAYMRENSIGLTLHYNQFHSPNTESKAMQEIRALRSLLDAHIGKAYGFEDLPLECGFYIQDADTLLLSHHEESLSEEEEELLNSVITPRVYTRDQALVLASQLRAIAGISGSLPWRYGWPEAVRDEVHSRLLVLNNERYAEEVNLGLHSKGTNKAAKTTSKRKAKSSSSAGLQLTSEPYQTGLKLF